MSSKLPNGLYLRSSLNADAGIGLQSLAAFSPDIIPLGHTTPEIADILNAYDHFIAHEIDPNESKTHIYLRAKAAINGTDASVQALVSLYTIQNELILWPQIWEKTPELGHALLSAAKDGEVVVAAQPILYNPPQMLGRHDAFIARSGSPNAKTASLADKVNNWRDLVKYTGQDSSLAAYNVVFADPLSPSVSLTTGLRLFEDKLKDVDLVFAVEAVGILTSDIDVAFSGHGSAPNASSVSFGLQRQALTAGGQLSANATLPANFDGTVTLNIFNDKKQTFGEYSSISLVVYALTHHKGSEGHVLLGAEHVVFHSDIRVKRLVKKYEAARTGMRNMMMVTRDAKTESAAVPPSFYFRENVDNGDTFPRPASLAMSPDIQPLGTTADPNVTTDLGPANYKVDITTERQINVYSGASNYIYLRGTTTRPVSGEVHLYIMPNSVYCHPSEYNKYPVYDVDAEGNQVTAVRKFSTNSTEAIHPILVKEPFNWANPPAPPAGEDYCAIAECKLDGLGVGGPYQWPHLEVGDFATGAEFVTWVFNEPYVGWRNISWVSNPNGASEMFRTCIIIPPTFSASDQWELQVTASGFPIGSAFSMDSTDPDIEFGKTNINSENQIAAVSFTGKGPGYQCQITVEWYSNGKAVQNGQKFSVQLVHLSYNSSYMAQYFKTKGHKSVSTGSTLLKVGKDYLNAKDTAGSQILAKTGGLLQKIGGAQIPRTIGDSDVVQQGILFGMVVGVDSRVFGTK